MAVSDVLKNFRNSSYGAGDKGNPEAPAPDDGGEAPNPDASPRTIMLTAQEQKSIEPYQVNPGDEITLEVSGRLEDDHFHVLSVNYSGGGEIDDGSKAVAEGLVGKVPGMPTHTIPSPS